MKIFKLNRVIFFFLFFGLSQSLYSYKCQYDNFQLYNTGQTKIEWGKLVYLYKCASGHGYWITSSYGSYGVDLNSFQNVKPLIEKEKTLTDLDLSLIKSTEFIKDFISTANNTNKNRTLGSSDDIIKTITTRQIPGANRVFKRCAPSVVLLTSLSSSSLGSGIVINKNGEIITNEHVVQGQEKMVVYFYDSEINSLEDLDPENYALAEVIAIDKLRDLALLKLVTKRRNLIPIKFGKYHKLEIAQDVFAIGHPGALVWSFSYGVISQLRKNYKWEYENEDEYQANVIQTQTPTNPGNSGGPLFNEKGNLIGINSFGFPDNEGLNFAVSVDEVNSFIDDAKTGKYDPPSVSITNNKDQYPDWESRDTNNNGIIDMWVIDLDSNGSIDLATVDENEDGIADYIIGDGNEDNKTDLMIIDKDQNGTFEYFYIDNDYNGEWDTTAVDTNGDLEPDVFFAYEGE